MAKSPLLALAVVSICAASLGAQNQLAPPQLDYALTNVRIVTAPGRVIERGTVLVRNGRIAAVGAQVTVPANVVQMNLNGHSVFPGLIDAATSVGLPSTSRPPSGGAPAQPAEAGRAGRGGGGGGGGRGAGGGGRGSATPAPVVLPELDAAAEAANMFAPTSDELAMLRSGGVTTVGLVFNGGLFPGRIGAALTGSYNEDRLALRQAVGQQVSFGTRRGGYPSTGIGAVAFIRQSFLDAQHEAQLDKLFMAGSATRPSYDPLRRALMPAASNQMPAWFVASGEREIQRVTEIAREMGLRNWIVVGAQEGWRSVAALKASGAPVVVSLQWPNANSVTGSAFSSPASPVAGMQPTAGRGPDPGSMVRANAVELARAGIPVALASFGGESGSTFRDRIRATIEAGMSADDALRAATITPATLLGVSAAVGSIEAGKLANLVVVSGNDLFASGTPIRHVFVEGRLYNMTPATPQRGGGAGDLERMR